MKGLSISLKMAAWYASSMLLVLGAFGVIMWFVLADSMLSWKDRTLQMRAGRVEAVLSAAAVANPYGPVQEATDTRLGDLLGILPEGEWIQLTGPDGRRLFPHGTILPRMPDLPFTPCPAPVLRDLRLGREHFRQLCHPVIYSGKPSYLLVPSPLAEDRILLRIFTSGLYRLLPFLLAVSGLGGYALSRRALRPIDLLIKEARTVTAMDLSRRLTVPKADDQMRGLAMAWNDLLSRIESAMIRVTQFTADASHELRSPIAYIRAAAEFSIGNVTTDPESRDAFRAIAEEAAVTGELLENLLVLAHPEEPLSRAGLDRVNVAAAVEDVLQHFRPIAVTKQQTLQAIAFSPTAALLIHPLHLRRVLTALVDNSIKYTPENGSISVSIEASDELTIRVTDNGIGIAQEYVHRIFDRFFRVDAARSDVGDGVGLGLPIAKWLTERNGGTISLESEPMRGTVVTVVFPGDMIANGKISGVTGRAVRRPLSGQ